MRGIVKTFPGVRALDGVDLVVRAGEVHCLLGQNGAGKSTLIKVLAGAHRPDEGEIEWQGEAVALATPDAAISLGHLHDLPGARPGRRAQRGREHLPRAREVPRRAAPARRHPQGRPRAARPARPRGDPRRPRGRHAARVRAADRQHGARALPRHPADRDGRAVRGARPAGGPDAVPGDPRPHRPGRRGRLHLPPPRGDPPGRRPGHRPQGRPHGGHRPARPRDPHLRADPADDRPRHRVRLPAARRRRRRGRPCSRWRASASPSRSPT